MPGISAWETAPAVYSFSSMLHNDLWDIARNQALEANYETGFAELNPIFIYKAS